VEKNSFGHQIPVVVDKADFAIQRLRVRILSLNLKMKGADLECATFILSHL
jgi:hypothetical protein